MANSARSGGLQTIFSFFLGLMLTAFVGVGVYTFYPPPEQSEERLEELSDREQEINESRATGGLTESEQAEMQAINRQRSDLHEAAAEARKPWGRRTSIVLIVFATLLMAVSLVRADQLPVISNGLLLGGVFTMIYGVGWIAATDRSMTRFLVITAALAITLGLGYARFVRRGTAAPATAGPALSAGSADLAAFESRVRDLEERLNEAAHALGSGGERSDRS